MQPLAGLGWINNIAIQEARLVNNFQIVPRRLPLDAIIFEEGLWAANGGRLQVRRFRRMCAMSRRAYIIQYYEWNRTWTQSELR